MSRRGLLCPEENKYNHFEMGYCLTYSRSLEETRVARAEGRKVGVVEKGRGSLGPNHIDLLGQEIVFTWR